MKPIDELASTLASASGIPSSLLSAVGERARKAERAVVIIKRFKPLGSGAEALAKRVVAGALRDHRAGVLERRCEP